MKIFIDGIGELKFSFQHRDDKSGTVCRCELDGAHYAAASQVADCDRFQRSTGRRVSLTRMLKRGLLSLNTDVVPMKWNVVHKFTREERTQIWAMYFYTHSDRKGEK